MKTKPSPVLEPTETARAYGEQQKAANAQYPLSGADVTTQSKGRRLTKTFVYPPTNFHLQVHAVC
jgi:hypothetical protein